MKKKHRYIRKMSIEHQNFSKREVSARLETVDVKYTFLTFDRAISKSLE